MELSIGKAARIAGLSVKTIRYYSDIGLVAASSRTGAGYRRFDEAGVARLQMIHALRDLGLDLGSIRRITEREVTLEEVARSHADAIDLHIHQLKLRRTVLRAIARGVTRPQEVHRMTAFAQASAEESRRLMEEFLDSVFAHKPDDPFAQRMRNALPELPAEPSSEQIDAWVELAGMVQDPGFRTRVQEMIEEGERQRTEGQTADSDAMQQAGIAVMTHAGAAVQQGLAPGSGEAHAIVGQVAPLYATAAGMVDGADYRRELGLLLAKFSDGRVERYWQLIGLINGWPSRPPMVPAYEWFIAALAAHPVP